MTVCRCLLTGLFTFCLKKLAIPPTIMWPGLLYPMSQHKTVKHKPNRKYTNNRPTNVKSKSKLRGKNLKYLYSFLNINTLKFNENLNSPFKNNFRTLHYNTTECKHEAHSSKLEPLVKNHLTSIFVYIAMQLRKL